MRPDITQTAALFHKEDPVDLDPEHPELVNLRGSADWKKLISGVAFWLQLALTLLSSAILWLSFTASPHAAIPGWSRCFTGIGIGIGFLTMWFSHVFIGTATRMQGGAVVSPSWISGNLLRCMALNVAGIVVTAVGLQASVGTLGIQSLATSAQAPYSAVSAAVAVVGMDVLSLQAVTNCLLSHAVSLVHLNLMFRLVRAARYPSGGIAANSMDGMALRSVDTQG